MAAVTSSTSGDYYENSPDSGGYILHHRLCCSLWEIAIVGRDEHHTIGLKDPPHHERPRLVPNDPRTPRDKHNDGTRLEVSERMAGGAWRARQFLVRGTHLLLVGGPNILPVWRLGLVHGLALIDWFRRRFGHVDVQLVTDR